MLDNDECIGNNHNCSHNCLNVPGSYECSCDKGYTLDEDQRTCVG